MHFSECYDNYAQARSEWNQTKTSTKIKLHDQMALLHFNFSNDQDQGLYTMQDRQRMIAK